MSGFGERLRRLRGERSQREIAGLLDMPITTYSTLENQDSLPRGTVLKKLSDFFAVQMSYFHAAPATALRSTESAKVWLDSLRSSEHADGKVAAHADYDIPEEIKSPIAARIRKIKELKDGKAPDEH